MTKGYKLEVSMNGSEDKDPDKVVSIKKIDVDVGGSTNGVTNGVANGKIESDNGSTKNVPEVKTRAATFGELFSFATCLDKFLIFIAILAAMAHGVAFPLMFIIFGDTTDLFVDYQRGGNITNGSAPSNGSFVDDFEDEMTNIALKYIYIGVGVCVAAYIHVSFFQLTGERQIHKMRRVFFKSLLRQNIGWYDKQQSGELTTRLADDMEKMKDGMGDKIGLAVQFLAQFLGGFVLGFVKGWKLALVIMSLTPLLAILAGVMGKLLTSYSSKEQEKYAKAGGVAEEVLSCIRTVISFNGQDQEIKRYGKALDESKKLGLRKSFVNGLSIGITMLVLFGAYGLAFWYGSGQVDEWQRSNGEEGLSPGTVLVVFFSVMSGSFAIGSASPHITSVLTAKGAGGTVFSIIKDEPIIDSSDPGGKKPAKTSGLIQFKDVTFSYPTREEVKVLQNFNLDIHPGQTVALVGASGCGKSTIVNLIQRFYDPNSGEIHLDGVDIKELNIHWLRGNIGVVSQEPILFGQSIAENIALGRPGISMEEIKHAAKKANAHDFISALPKGYETLVGERGAQLSGGQKQRVAIARALVRDPKILLLDEATSALDSESESIVQAALDKARQGRTTIVVAHRLSTIQNADLIYVLDNGILVETGKHEELMNKKGAYYSLVTLQTIVEREDEEFSADEAGMSSDSSMPVSAAASSNKYSRQLSQSGTTRKSSFQGSDVGSPKKTVSLFKPNKKEENEDEDEKNVAKPGFGRILKANLKECHLILIGCFASMINGVITPLFALFFSQIIKAFTKTGQELLDEGLFWSLMFVLIGGVAFFGHIMQNTSFGFSGEYLTARLRRDTFKNILRQDVEYFDNSKHTTGALTTRLATDASSVKNATGFRLGIILQSIASMAAGLTIAFLYGWKLALAVLGAAPIMFIAGGLQMKLLKGNQARDYELLEAAGKTASECVENIRTVQSLTREPHFHDKYCEELIKPHKQNMRRAQVYGVAFGFSQSIIFLIYAAAFKFGSWLVVHDGMEPDLVFRVLFAIAFTGMALGQASSFMPDYTKAQISAGKIFTMLDLVPRIDISSTGGTVKPTISGEIQLKNVSFRYPSRPDVQVLNGVNIHVRPGQTAALVGMSGCGKSTIVSLLQRFYDPEDGVVLVEGLDLRQYNLHSIRSMMSVVSQEPILFDRSIRENIVYGLEEDSVPMADVIAAARTANAHDFITALPEGYNTLVGEKGTQLSGGQKQRVAIARALVRNPKILLLDEATSALDTESEKVVQKALDKAREGRTCIVIAHRLSTIQNADVIFTMEGGKVVEHGTHLELLANNGAYATLIHGQKFKKFDKNLKEEKEDEDN